MGSVVLSAAAAFGSVVVVARLANRVASSGIAGLSTAIAFSPSAVLAPETAPFAVALAPSFVLT
jgi:hypothetical protein